MRHLSQCGINVSICGINETFIPMFHYTFTTSTHAPTKNAINPCTNHKCIANGYWNVGINEAFSPMWDQWDIYPYFSLYIYYPYIHSPVVHLLFEVTPGTIFGQPYLLYLYSPIYYVQPLSYIQLYTAPVYILYTTPIYIQPNLLCPAPIYPIYSYKQPVYIHYIQPLYIYSPYISYIQPLYM